MRNQGTIMDQKKLSAFLLALLIGAGACTRRSAVNETPRPTELATTPSPEQYHQGGVVSAVPAKFFKGSIGNTLGLQMKLTREGEQLSGNYFYQKVGTRIDVKGTVDKDNNVTLEEIGSGGKLTG